MCLAFSEKHGAFKAGDHFIPATGVVTIIGGMGQAARFRGGAGFTQTDVTGDSIETFLGKGLLDVKIGSPRPLGKTCNAVKKLAG